MVLALVLLLMVLVLALVDRTETITYGTDIVDSGTSSTVLANIIC